MDRLGVLIYTYRQRVNQLHNDMATAERACDFDGAEDCSSRISELQTVIADLERVYNQ